MAYCAYADLVSSVGEDVLVQLTDDTGAGEADMDKVTAAISAAEAEINGYCGTRYGVPFAPVPAIIKKMCEDIAAYNLYALRDSIPEARTKRYDNAVRFLAMVAKGLISLGANDPDGAPAPVHRPDIESDERLFSRDKLEGF